MRMIFGFFLVFGLVGCGSAGKTAVEGLDPTAGPTDGDQPVKIHGSNFRPETGYTVYFGTQKSDSVTLMDPGTLVAVTPRRAQPGEVDVTIYSDDGAAFRIPKGYRYSVPSKSTGPSDSQKLRY